jgi:2-iminoacetate synthase ThiH
MQVLCFLPEAGQTKGYLLFSQELHAKIEETIAWGGTQLLIQGGLHPGSDLVYFEVYIWSGFDLLHFCLENIQIILGRPAEFFGSGTSKTGFKKKVLSSGWSFIILFS